MILILWYWYYQHHVHKSWMFQNKKTPSSKQHTMGGTLNNSREGPKTETPKEQHASLKKEMIFFWKNLFVFFWQKKHHSLETQSSPSQRRLRRRWSRFWKITQTCTTLTRWLKARCCVRCVCVCVACVACLCVCVCVYVRALPPPHQHISMLMRSLCKIKFSMQYDRCTLPPRLPTSTCALLAITLPCAQWCWLAYTTQSEC